MCDKEDKKGKNIFKKIILTKNCRKLEEFDSNEKKKDYIIKNNYI